MIWAKQRDKSSAGVRHFNQWHFLSQLRVPKSYEKQRRNLCRNSPGWVSAFRAIVPLRVTKSENATRSALLLRGRFRFQGH